MAMIITTDFEPHDTLFKPDVGRLLIRTHLRIAYKQIEDARALLGGLSKEHRPEYDAGTTLLNDIQALHESLAEPRQ